MRRPLVLLALLLAGPAAAQRRPAAPAAPAPLTDAAVRARLDGLDAYVEAAMRDWKVPGLAVAVVRGDRVVFERGYGVREVGKPEPVDAHTVFAVASNSKAVTAAALGILVGTGRLSWDDRVADHLPAFQLRDPFATRELTVRDLLSHRTGYETWGGDLLWYGSDLPVAEVLRRVRYLEPVTSFRSSWGYSNLMFVAAGALIPAITDTSWADFVTAHFTRPLGMTRTTTTTAALDGQANVARPHTLVGGAVRAVPYRPLEGAAPAAAFNSSVHDWSRWIALHLTGGVAGGRRLVSAAALGELRQPHAIRRIGPTTRRLFPSTHVLLYGLGWDLRDYRGRYLVSHTGGMDGMVSMTGFVPEDSVGVVVFTNYDEANLYAALFWHVLDRVLADERVDWSRRYLDLQNAATPEAPARTEGTRPSRPLDAYAGVYRHPMLGAATVTTCREDLCVALEHHPGLRGPLTHWHHDTFEAAWADPYFRTSLVPFELDAAGRPVRFRLQVRPDFVDPQVYVFERAP